MRDWVVKTSCLQAEREVPQKGDTVLREPKVVRFAFMARYHGPLSRDRVCRLLGVSNRNLRAMIPTIHMRNKSALQ
ncbi:hypothetical protein AD940_02670 [Gluconobacter thailandicus]|nr:hypothetical protein AD940_02670 [Gluconobacter thailandicus]